MLTNILKTDQKYLTDLLNPFLIGKLQEVILSMKPIKLCVEALSTLWQFVVEGWIEHVA